MGMDSNAQTEQVTSLPRLILLLMYLPDLLRSIILRLEPR